MSRWIARGAGTALLATALGVAITIGAPMAQALTVLPPSPQKWELGDGLVFHVTPLVWFENWSDWHPNDYPPSGLYRDGKLVYEVALDWLGDPCFTADGMAFVDGFGEWRYQEGARLLGFRYPEGFWSIPVQELLSDGGRALDNECEHGWMGGPFCPSWNIREKRVCDSANGLLHLVTVEGGEVTIDLAAATVHADLPARVVHRSSHLMVVAVLSVTALTAGVITAALRRRHA
ncbi:MAG: hypothetical protein FWD83_06250 [Promicromonosporaceae bacterium]|nr:hypothetical protein [Promicromonosporaceae bacterium]